MSTRISELSGKSMELVVEAWHLLWIIPLAVYFLVLSVSFNSLIFIWRYTRP